jgi:hypothetical protein
MFAQSHLMLRSSPLLGGLAMLAIVVSACSFAGAATETPSAPSVSAATAQTMGAGTFHDVDGMATGDAKLVVLPDGTYEVVLETFKIESIAHTNLVLVSNPDVAATADVDKTKLLDLGSLKATEGMQDFVIPAEMAASVMEGYHTAVIWDTEMAHAIAAAPLK